MRLAMAAAGVAALVVSVSAAGAAPKDCGNGPDEHPGKNTPTHGHWTRCADTPPVVEPPAPEPPVVPKAPVVSPPPGEPPPAFVAAAAPKVVPPRGPREVKAGGKTIFLFPGLEVPEIKIDFAEPTPAPWTPSGMLTLAVLLSSLGVGAAVPVAGRPGL